MLGDIPLGSYLTLSSAVRGLVYFLHPNGFLYPTKIIGSGIRFDPAIRVEDWTLMPNPTKRRNQAEQDGMIPTGYRGHRTEKEMRDIFTGGYTPKRAMTA
jgi:hypothetical protein